MISQFSVSRVAGGCGAITSLLNAMLASNVSVHPSPLRGNINFIQQMTFSPGDAATMCAAKGETLCYWPQYNGLVSLPSIAGGHLSYVAIIFGLKAVMANVEAPFDPKLAMRIYNLTQVVLSVTMAVSLAPYLLNGVFNLNGGFNKDIEFWILVHYGSKYLDMFDSLFMVLRKKSDQLTFLHVYHHLTIGAIWGLLLHFGTANGTAFYGAWINSVVHALMYFHYFITSFGIHNPLKKYLTQFQMAQFATCMLHAVLVIFVDRQITTPWALLQLCYHMTLLFLFARFYNADRKKEKRSKRIE